MSIRSTSFRGSGGTPFGAPSTPAPPAIPTSPSRTSADRTADLSSELNEPIHRACRSATGYAAPATNRLARKSKLKLSRDTGSRRTTGSTNPRRTALGAFM